MFEATKNSKWLDRGRAAAEYAETYIYIWNVLIPADEDDQLWHWKKGVPTYGVQLIATGDSLVDNLHGIRCGRIRATGALDGRHALPGSRYASTADNQEHDGDSGADLRFERGGGGSRNIGASPRCEDLDCIVGGCHGWRPANSKAYLDFRNLTRSCTANSPSLTGIRDIKLSSL